MKLNGHIRYLPFQILLQQRNAKEHNPLNRKTLNPAINKMPENLKQILIDSQSQKPYFSNTTAYTINDVRNNIKEPDNIYKGKDLEITLPHTSTNAQQAIAIFAYQYEPNYKACQVIRINDYPQITIDCTLAETLRAYHRQDNISTLGWGVSYVCQKLWHDNPSNAKDLTDLIYTDSHSQDFLDSIPNLTMKSIVKDILPRITLQEFDIGEPRNQSKFYAELDWDKFYMQFPMMKELEREFENFKSVFDATTFKNNFIDFLNVTISNKEDTPQEYIMTLDTEAMRANKTKNEEVFRLYKKEESLPKTLTAIQNLQKPSQIISNKIYFQRFGITSKEFIQHFGFSSISDRFEALLSEESALKQFNSDPKHKQNFALYSIAGAFNILYIPSLIQVMKAKEETIYIPLSIPYKETTYNITFKKMRAFIIDSVDFNNDKKKN